MPLFIDGIEDKQALTYFKKLYKKLPKKALERKFVVGRYKVKLKEFPSHLKCKDEIGNLLSLMIKSYISWEKNPDYFEKKLLENTKVQKKGNRLNKNVDWTMVVVLPSIDKFSRGQKQFYDTIIKPILNEENKFKIKPKEVYCCGKYKCDNPKKEGCIEEWIFDKCEDPNFLYFTAITDGYYYGIEGDNNQIILDVNREKTLDICPGHHFNFFSCSSGSYMADKMVENKARHVHGYLLPVIFPDGSYRYAIAHSKVDESLLNENYHSQAHENCVKEYLRQAKLVILETKGIIEKIFACFEAACLIYCACIKTHKGPDCKLIDKAIQDSTMHINKIEMQKEIQNVWWLRKVRAKAVVTVVDEQGKPVPGATVNGLWSGNATNESRGSTNSSGKVTMLSDWYWSRRGRFTFTVGTILQKDRKYVPNENKQTRGSVDINIWGRRL